MRILIVVVQFPPDVNSTGNLMAELAERWAARGHEVSVLTALPHYKDFRIEADYRGRLFQRDRCGALDVLRLWVYAPGKKSMFKRLINYLSFAIGAALAGLFWRKSWDVILCCNGSFFSGIASWLISRLKGTLFIYNVQDLYPEVPVEAGQLRNPCAIAILKRIEGFMYRKAHRISVISAAIRDNLLGKSVPAEKIDLIPNFVNTEFIRSLPRSNGFSQTNGLEGKFVVMHAGNLGYVYDLGSLLASAKALTDQRDIMFLIVGDGVAKAQLQQQVQESRLENVLLLPFQPREQLPWLRATADVQVSLYKRGAARHSMPSKIYEIMASGRPLLASAERQSEIWQLVQETECGVCVEPEQPEQLAAAIRRLHADAALRKRLALNGRNWAQVAYGKDAVADTYEEVMRNMLGSPASPASQAENFAPNPQLSRF